mgnify:FL=1
MEYYVGLDVAERDFDLRCRQGRRECSTSYEMGR